MTDAKTLVEQLMAILQQKPTAGIHITELCGYGWEICDVKYDPNENNVVITITDHGDD